MLPHSHGSKMIGCLGYECVEPRPIQNHADFARLLADIGNLPDGLGAFTLAVTSTFSKESEFTPAMLDAMKSDLRNALARAIERIDYDVIMELIDASESR